MTDEQYLSQLSKVEIYCIILLEILRRTELKYLYNTKSIFIKSVVVYLALVPNNIYLYTTSK